MSSEQQLPPADELFDVRDKIKQLTSRERELKAIVITDHRLAPGTTTASRSKTWPPRGWT